MKPLAPDSHTWLPPTSFPGANEDFYFSFAFIPLVLFNDASLTHLLLLLLLFMLLGFQLFFWIHQRVERRKEMEQLRQQIARDFHDELGSHLSVISMYSELIRNRIGEGDPTVSRYLEKIFLASNKLYGSMKDLLWMLQPGHDGFKDLLIKIRDFGEDLFSDSEMGFHVNGMFNSNEQLQLPMDCRRHILLIFKEAMNNALKHSDAREITLMVSRQHSRIVITLMDDGKGFHIEEVRKGEGLNNMQARAGKIGAELQLSSESGRTCVRVNLPLDLFSKESR